MLDKNQFLQLLNEQVAVEGTTGSWALAISVLHCISYLLYILLGPATVILAMGIAVGLAVYLGNKPDD